MEKTINKKKVGIYIRVSTEEQAKEGISLQSQRKKLEDYAEFKGWWVYKIYEDAGFSGKSIKGRPAFTQMLKDAYDGKFSTILIFKFDRAFRNTKEALITFDELNERQIDFVSISEDIDTTTAMGKFFFTIISALGELERKLTNDRVKFVRQNRFDEGIMVCRSPYGYEPIIKDKKVIGFKPKTKEANIVKQCFEMTLEGIGYRYICDKFKIKPQSYYNIIKNPVYCGYIEFDGKKKKGEHEPIISESLFESVQSKINRRIVKD